MQIFMAALKPMRFHRAKKTRRRDGTLTDVLMLGLCSMASSSSISDKVPLSVLSRLSAWGGISDDYANAFVVIQFGSDLVNAPKVA